jgi:hypothetical protein
MAGASVYFEEPVFELSVLNSFGIPLTLKFNNLIATASDGGQSLAITGSAVDDSIVFNSPSLAQVGIGQSTLITLDKNTSNIRDIIAMPPTQMIFDVQVGTNTNQDRIPDNHVTDSSKFSIDLNVIIPMYGRVKNLVMQDTTDFNIKIDSVKELEYLDYVTLYFVTENDFPVEVGLQVYFMTDSFEVIDSLISPYSKLIQPGQVNAITGKVDKSTTDFTKIVMTKERFENLTSSTKLLIKGILETKDNGNTSVKFYSNYGIRFKLGVVGNGTFKL